MPNPSKPRTALQRHVAAVSNAEHQHGVVSRAQLLSLGWTPEMIRGQIESQRWQRVLRGVYAVHTGSVEVEALWWAAHLRCGDDSVLHGESAIQAWGIARPELPVHIAIGNRRTIEESTGDLIIHRVRRPRPTRCPRGLPPATAAQFAVLDATRGMSDAADVMALVSAAVQRGKTSAGQLDRALAQTPRLKHRALIQELILELRGGATTSLEIDGVRNILRAHDLPEGRGQVRSSQGGQVIYRDRIIEPFGLIIEFDGRLGHTDPHGRFRDHRRDNAAIATGQPTLRFGWQDVHDEPCSSAGQVAGGLARLGWTGLPTQCNSGCGAASMNRI